ncbi:MAG TPA: UpxY family transcription antiterminator [Candidatus Angelobacter sp.]|nr:UpxY family transcription antiterminator [Candidatus Angelobacter sp.]
MAGNAASFQVFSNPFLSEQCRDAVEPAQWYALYTCPRHEKMVQQQLNGKTIECYLPLYQSLRRWNDRKALVDLPLFPGYLFVRIPLSARLRVLTVPGVVRIISFNGKPASLTDEEILALRASVSLRAAEPYPYLSKGRRIRIAAGPLKGLEGIVVRRKNKLRAVVSIHSIMQSYAVELDVADAEAAA